MDELAEYASLNEDRVHMVHMTCRDELKCKARKMEKLTQEKSASVSRVMRHMTGGFSFKDMCFYCSEMIEKCKPKDVRKVTMGPQLDAAVREMVAKRHYDDWATAVLGRLEGVSDLFASDALYHISCRARFSQGLPHTPLKRKRGRPVREVALSAFEQLCYRLEAASDNELYTLQMLHKLMCETADIDEDSAAYSKEYLRELLKNKYGDHIYFALHPGKTDVVGFKKRKMSAMCENGCVSMQDVATQCDLITTSSVGTQCLIQPRTVNKGKFFHYTLCGQTDTDGQTTPR